jgi:signal transduction histidine kinase
VDGDTAAARVWRTGRPARIDSYAGLEGELAETLRSLGFRSAIAAPVVIAGRLWGAMIVSSVDPDPLPAGSEQRISDFAELAAQAMANAEAREQLAASRKRIVQAGDAERRRLERNLHDGAQQRLVSLALDLRMIDATLEKDPPKARNILEGAQEQLAQGLDELRELARGIHPAVLTDRGLGPALEALVNRAPLPVELTELPDERLSGPVEAAAYYVVAEAVTNVAKYARASHVTVSVRRSNGSATIEVADDGIGGADASLGTGLRGLADRLEALDGRLEVDSPVERGTRISAEIPYPE